MVVTDLNVLRANSLTTVLQSEIEHLILSGSFAGGERLNENTLAERFKVSRGPVREACRALAEKGLLELIPNRGVFVRQLSQRDAEELYDVRAGLFGLAARLLAPKITDAELNLLDELTDKMDKAVEARSLDDYYPLNLTFHEMLLRGAGNERLNSEYQKLIKELHLFRARGLLHGGGLTVSNEEHREIVAALRRHDAIDAYEAAFRHVQNGKARMLSVNAAEAKAS
jgi:DNA-binding GntR family transcriptional regulator